MHAALRAYLLSVTPNIAWNTRPQATGLPAIVLQQVSGAVDEHFEGRFSAQEARVQLDIFGETFAQAQALYAGVEARLSQPFQQGGWAIKCFIDSRRDTAEQAASRTIHRISIDLITWHKEL